MATRPRPALRDLAPWLLGALAITWLVNLFAIGVGPWEIGADKTIAFEGGPWTWLSVALLLGTAWLVVDGSRDRSDRRWWLALAVLLVYLAADEGLVLHERFDDLAGIDGIDHWGWAIPGVVLVGAVGWFFWGWLWRLAPRLRLQLVLGGLLFVGGALGVEVLAGLWQSEHGEDRVFFLITTVEETCEVAGVLVIARAIFRGVPLSSRESAATLVTP